jgi:hypothetical protein
LIKKDVTSATRLALNAFFQQVGKIMFPNDWDETEAASLLKPQASRAADEKVRAAQKRGADVDEELCEQLLGGSIKIAVDLESLGKLIPATYRDEKAQDAQLIKKYLDEGKPLNRPGDYMKIPSVTSIFTSDEHEVFDSLELLIGDQARNYYEIRIDRMELDRIDWSTGKISVERNAIDVDWDSLKFNEKDIAPQELNNLTAWILNPDAALSLFTPHETPSSNAKQTTRVKHDWNEICGLMWRCLAVEKPLSDEFALQTRLKNTVTDDLERNDLPVPSHSQLMVAANHVLDQYTRSDIVGPFRVKFGRGKSARLGAEHKKPKRQGK